MKDWKKIFHANGDQKKAGVEKLTSDKIDFVIKTITRDRASLVVQSVDNLPAIQKTWIQSLGQEDPLEEVMVTHSSILIWIFP